MSEEKKEILLGDCLELMKDIPNGSIDMILADLPYGTTACKWDTIIPFDKLWEQYERLIKPNGVIALTATQPFAYDDGGGFADLKNMNFYTMVYNEVYPEFNDDQNGQDDLLRYITAMPVGTPDEKLYYAPHTAGGIVTAYDKDNYNSGGLVMRFIKFVKLLESVLGITIEGKKKPPKSLNGAKKTAFG